MIAALWALACGTPEVAAPEVAAPEAAAPEAVAPEAVAARDWKHFGAPFTIASATPASVVFADPTPLAGKVVRVEGELTEVCQKMGCWAVVRDDAGHAVRITMKDHAFGIDKDTAGRSCDVEGELVKKTVDPERVEHFESEGSTNPPEAGKTEAWELVATSVAVARS